MALSYAVERYDTFVSEYVLEIGVGRRDILFVISRGMCVSVFLATQGTQNTQNTDNDVNKSAQLVKLSTSTGLVR